jgi:y4mF family transcriptional regulator
MDYQTLPEYVKQMRKRYGLTQLELSEKAGVGLRFVRELEQGKVSLRMDKVNHVLQLFGATLAPFRMNQNESDA